MRGIAGPFLQQGQGLGGRKPYDRIEKSPHIVGILQPFKGFLPERHQLERTLRSRQRREPHVGPLGGSPESRIRGRRDDLFDILDDGAIGPAQVSDNGIFLIGGITLLVVDRGETGSDLVSAENAEDAEEAPPLAAAGRRHFREDAFNHRIGLATFPQHGEDGVFENLPHLPNVLALESVEEGIDILEAGDAADGIENLDALLVRRG